MKGKDFVSVLKDAHPDVPKIGLKAPVPKIGRLFFFTRMRPGQNDRKHPLLVLLSVLCKSLQRSLIFIALPFSAYALFGKAGAKVRCFFIPSKCFERKVCENYQLFRLFYKTWAKTGHFGGKGRKKGISREHDPLVMRAAWEAKRGHIVGKRSLGGAKQGQENRGNGTRRTETRVSYGWEAYFLLIIYITQERRK